MAKRKNRNSTGSLVMIASGLLLIAITIGWYLLSGASRTSGTASITPTSPGDYPQVVRISPEDAKKALDQSEAVFIDVRSVEEYNQRHILGALSIPLLELPDRLGELDPNLWYITYCT